MKLKTIIKVGMALLLLFFWGIINEYLHNAHNGILQYFQNTIYYPMLDTYTVRFEVAIYMLGIIVLVTTFVLCFSDDIINLINKYRSNKNKDNKNP